MIKRILLLSCLTLSITMMGCLYKTEINTDKTQLEITEPSIEQMKADLIGHNLFQHGQPLWQFAALSEYEEFEVKDKQIQGNAIEYDVSLKLKDFSTNTHYLADIFIVYKNINGKWELASIVAKAFEQVSNLNTY
ncbi:hypothetical protein ACFLTT_01290 [Chloroflexota bacterium]